jgi:TolB protein
MTALAASDARAQEGASVFTMKVDGSDVQQLPRVPGTVWNGSPSYSPDGKTIAFDGSSEVFGGAPTHIFVTSIADPQAEPKDLGLGSCPAWSRDGKTLIFDMKSNNAAGLKTGVWTMKADGTQRRWFCDGERARWSPDGSAVAVSDNYEGSPTLFLHGAKSRRRLLFDKYDRLVGATWSPDGSKLAFIGMHNKEAELGILDPNGAKESFAVRWTGNIGWQPAWSPDGKQILLWVKDDQGASRLNLIAVEGTEGPREIPGQQGKFNSDATWSPDGSRITFASDRGL